MKNLFAKKKPVVSKAQAVQNKRSNIYLKALKQRPMGYDFDGFIGDPLEGFGNPLDDMGMGFKIKIKRPSIKISAPKIKIAPPKITAPKIAPPKIIAGGIAIKPSQIKVPTVKQIAAGAGKVAGAIASSPTKLVDSTVKQVGGHKLVGFLDKTTGGTYTQAVNVGQLPGKALAGQAITKKDLDDVKGLAVKAAVAAATVYGAGSVAGAASNMVQQQAAKELAKKVGGSAGSIIASAGSLAAGDVSGAATTFAKEEAKRMAVQQASKSLGKEAGSILAIGTAGATGGAAAALAKTKDIAKDKAMVEVAKKTGLPASLVSAVAQGKVPTAAQVKESMQKELQAAPAKLQAELASLPAKIAAAPANTKNLLLQKQELIKQELLNRDKVVVELAKKHVDELKNANEKIAEAAKKVDLKKLDLNKAIADLEKLRALNASAAALKAAEERVAKERQELASLDAQTVVAVAEKENADAVMEAKKVSAANGQYGVRAFDKKYYEHPVLVWYEKAELASKA